MRSGPYVLVTPVRNEERTIGITLECVVKQTITPEEWVIVSDGSTDRTDEIVEGYAARFSFIRLLPLKRRPARNFASVVFALEAGIAALQTKDYSFIGLLDADIRFGEKYYEEIMLRFAEQPGLGLAGGLVFDCYDGVRRRSGLSLLDIAGAVQFFRRECFESLEGLKAIPEGGWDTLTCVQARMRGFKTQTFREIEVEHLKPRNVSEGSVLRRSRQLGARDYAMGNHPLFELMKCGYRCREYPILLAGLMRLVGYCLCYLRRRPRMIPPEIMEFIRQEQLNRLFRMRGALQSQTPVAAEAALRRSA